MIGDNRVRLYTSVLAAMALRAFPSPVFPDVPPDELTAYTRHGNPHIAVGEDRNRSTSCSSCASGPAGP